MPLLNLAHEVRRLRQAIRRHWQEPPTRQRAQVVQQMHGHLLGKARINTRAVAREVRVIAAHTQPRPYSTTRGLKEEAAQPDGERDAVRQLADGEGVAKGGARKHTILRQRGGRTERRERRRHGR